MKLFGLLILVAIAVGAYANCGCLKCNSNLHVITKPLSPIRFIYKENPCTCPAKRRLPYSFLIPVKPPTWNTKAYGFDIQGEKVTQQERCPCTRSYDGNVQIPIQPRTPSYLSGLKSYTDRIIITPSCRPPAVEGPNIETFSSFYDEFDGDHVYNTKKYYYTPNRYERNFLSLIQKQSNGETIPFGVLGPEQNKDVNSICKRWKKNQHWPFLLLQPYKVVIQHKKPLGGKSQFIWAMNFSMPSISKYKSTNQRSKRAIKWGLPKQQSDNYIDQTPKTKFSLRKQKNQEPPCRTLKCAMMKPNKPKISYDKILKKTAKTYLKANPIKKLKPKISKGAKVITTHLKKAAVFFTNLVRKAKPLNSPPELQFPDYSGHHGKSKMLKKKNPGKHIKSRLFPKVNSRIVGQKKKNVTRHKRQINFRRHKKLRRYDDDYDEFENEVEDEFDPYDDNNFMESDDSDFMDDRDFMEDDDRKFARKHKKHFHKDEPETFITESNPESFLKPFNVANLIHPTTMIHLLNTPIRYLNHFHNVKSHMDPILETIPKVARESRNYIFDLMKNFGLKAFRVGANALGDITKLNKLPLLSKMRFKRNLDSEMTESNEKFEVDTIVKKIGQLEDQIKTLQAYDYLKDVQLYESLATLQKHKNNLVNNWKSKPKIDYLRFIEHLRRKSIFELIAKLKEPNQPFKSRLIKILVVLQKMKCFIKVLALDKNNEIHHLKRFYELNAIQTDGFNNTCIKLRDEKVEALRDQFSTLYFLNKIIDGGEVDKLKEEAKILWEINNIEKLQSTSIKELSENNSNYFAISKELKILFDLQRQLDKCVEKEKMLKENANNN